MSRYLSIRAIQSPFPIGVDSNDRTMYSVNFDLVAASPVADMEGELAARLISEGAATALATDVWIGLEAVLPEGDGPYITIIDTGGTSPFDVHGDAMTYENLSCQIVIRAQDQEAAHNRALLVWRALHGVYNTTLTA